jgi:Protein of unknown function (DUF1194)
MALTLRGAILGLALVLALPRAYAQSQDEVDLALVLAVDSSGSVDFGEYDLQTEGIAGAFRDPEVIEAIERGAPKGIAVSVVLWSGRGQQRVAVDWTRVRDRASADALAARIEAMGRGMLAETALGEALRFAIDRLERSPFTADRRIIDISGDGRSNVGKDPDAYRDAAIAAGITINGLAILHDDLTLDLYYADHVVGGREAFVTTAHDYDDFARAMRHKLLKEIGGTPLG